MVKLVSNLVSEKQLRAAQLRALKLFADTVKQTYGPMGGYTTYSEYVAGSKTEIVGNYTKDGFTVLKHIQCDKPIESLIKDDIRTICTQVIKVIGDGTTSATILSYLIFKGLLELQNEKYYPKRKIIKAFKQLIKTGINMIKANKRDCTLDDIYNIAYTSLDGNEEMANIITDIYKQSGMNVYIDVSASNSKDTVVKTYNGMVYNAGFTNQCFINNPKDSTCTLPNAHVYIFESPIDTPEMSNILRLIFNTEVTQKIAAINNGEKVDMNSTVVICPHISRDENGFLDNLETYFNNIKDVALRPKFCIVTNLNNDNGYLLDIKSMTDAKFIKKYIDPKTYEKDKAEGLAPTEMNIKTFAGTAEKVVVSALDIKIINPSQMYTNDENGELQYSDFFNTYVGNLKSQLKTYEETKEELLKIANLKRRINLLESNMVDLYVGGIGASDRMVLNDAIEDAVLNCRSAAKEGVCFAANYEGIRVFTKLNKLKYTEMNELRATMVDKTKNNELNAEQSEQLTNAMIMYDTSTVLYTAYEELVKQIYLPYTDSEAAALKLIIISIASSDSANHCPFNIITEEFDGKVLTSAETEPAILDSISRIITNLFNTNQFLVPDPRFNIYGMDDEDEAAEKELEERQQLNASGPVIDELASKLESKEDIKQEVENDYKPDITSDDYFNTETDSTSTDTTDDSSSNE